MVFGPLLVLYFSPHLILTSDLDVLVNTFLFSPYYTDLHSEMDRTHAYFNAIAIHEVGNNGLHE